MRFTEPGMPEHAVAAHFEYLCARDGAQRPAYVPVVASGYVSSQCSSRDVVDHPAHTSPNGLIIHYTSNNQLIADGEMVLIDAGCEYKCV